MFYGKYSHSLDDKNRVRIPANFKSNLSGGACIGKSRESKCLVIYQKEAIEELGSVVSQAKKNQGISSMEIKAISQYLSNIYDIAEDPQGRFTLNQRLKEYAGIKKNIIFVGNNDKIEIWAEENFVEEDDEDLDSVDLSRFGL